jgi:hypothetical protein
MVYHKSSGRLESLRTFGLVSHRWQSSQVGSDAAVDGLCLGRGPAAAVDLACTLVAGMAVESR